MSMPYTIKTIIDQCRMSMMRVGASQLTYRNEEKWETSSESDAGIVWMSIGLYFRVNTTRRIYMYIAYEPDDTYTAWLCEVYPASEFANTGKGGKILARERKVYCDNLGATIESMYDQYINEHQRGFIRI